MPAMIRRHRLFMAVLSCVLLVVAGWAWVSQLRATGPATLPPSAAAQKPSGPAFGGHSAAANLNANTRSVAEATKDGKHPERLSAMFRPAAFNKAKFEADPQAYLDVVEPGRVWQTAEPGLDVKQLQPKSLEMSTMTEGGSTELAVTGAPQAPVTFTSFDGGVFENQLNSMTVRANAKGEAHVTFTATPGTIANVTILAGSPMTSEQVRFVVKVESPQ